MKEVVWSKGTGIVTGIELKNETVVNHIRDNTNNVDISVKDKFLDVGTEVSISYKLIYVNINGKEEKLSYIDATPLILEKESSIKK